MNRRQWFVAAFPTTLAMAAGAATAAPRYRLSVGQELVYHSDLIGKRVPSGEISFTERCTTRMQVVAADAGGGWHVIEEINEDFGGGNQSVEKPQTLASFDLAPDGSFKIDPAMELEGSPKILFPKLPPDRGPSAAWSSSPDPFGEFTQYRLAAPTTQPAAGRFNFVAVDAGPMEHIYQWAPTFDFQLDLQHGVLAGGHMLCDEPLHHMVETETTELKSNEVHSKAWADAFAAQASTAMDAIARYNKAMDAADTAGNASDNRMAANLRILQDARGQISEPALLEQLAGKIDRHSDYIQEIKDDATQEKIVGKPAPLWDLPDLTGKHHALTNLRGQVVVIDFWYRGCGWCMRAMPAMKQLAEDYKNKPVAFFGMNVDSDDKDAQFVADYFKLPYATLRTHFAPHASDPTTKPADEQVPAATYHVQGYPTLFIIGPDGIIRQMHVGYSPTMHDELAKQINALLTQQATAAE